MLWQTTSWPTLQRSPASQDGAVGGRLWEMGHPGSPKVRLSAVDYEAVVRAAKSRNESFSEFLRRAALEATQVS